MTWTTFGTLNAGNQPLSLLDGMFGNVAGMGQFECSASGTNTIALAPNANQPTISSYRQYSQNQLFGFAAANTSTGGVSINVSSIGALPLYMPDGVTQAGSGNIIAGSYYLVVYNAALNSGGGGFQIISQNLNSVPITNSLAADVNLNNTSTYFDGPAVAQGTSGTWFVSGTITVSDTATQADILVKLWDGTTVIASTQVHVPVADVGMPASLSGYITAPAGNLRISAKDNASTTGIIWANNTGNGKDSTITAFRIK